MKMRAALNIAILIAISLLAALWLWQPVIPVEMLRPPAPGREWIAAQTNAVNAMRVAPCSPIGRLIMVDGSLYVCWKHDYTKVAK